MIAPDALADLDRLLEGARLGNRPPLSQRQRETIAELAAYYKVAQTIVPTSGDEPCITMPDVGTLEARPLGRLVVETVGRVTPLIHWETSEGPEGAP